ncbi:MAG: hypothetical protein ABSF03_08460 [Streptosporangiaceae bacterium]
MRWPFDRRVDAAHAWGVIAVGTAVLVGIPAVLATLHAADSQFRWWWPTSWMAVPLIIFIAGCLLVAVPVRRSPDPRPSGAASPARSAVPSPGGDRAGVTVRPGQVVAGEIPREPAAYVARETVSRLAAAAVEGRVTVVCPVMGLRGVGKTQVAAAYARARADQGWGLVGWVSAETRDVLLDGLTRVADALGVADPEGDSLESARRLRAYLQTRAGPGLLVFDNATDPDGLREFLPATGGTQVVVTTTDRAFAGLGQPVEVSAFTRPQSVSYLRARTGLADQDGADTVADQLGDLPLGLAQAAATITRQHLIYARYLERLRQVPVRELLGRQPGEDYPHATAAALLLSVQATEASDPTGLAGWLLRVLAALSPDGIPRTFLDGLPKTRPGQRLAILRRRARHRRQWEVDAAIERCVAGSLLEWSVTGDAVLMHRLLARVLRERDQASGQWARTVTAALNLLEPLLFPETQAWARREDGARLAAQAEALWDADTGAGTSDRDLALRSYRPGPGQSASSTLQPTSAAPSPPASRPSPTPNVSWAPTTPTRSPPGATSRVPTSRRAAWDRRSRCMSRPWPIANGCWAPTTPTRSPRGTTSRPPTRWRAARSRRFRCSSRPWPTANGSWAPTTPTRLSRGTTSHTPTRRQAAWTRRFRCTSRPWPTVNGSWAPTTPTRSPRGTTSNGPESRILPADHLSTQAFAR